MKRAYREDDGKWYWDDAEGDTVGPYDRQADADFEAAEAWGEIE
jgi:hypothetical protein